MLKEEEETVKSGAVSTLSGGKNGARLNDTGQISIGANVLGIKMAFLDVILLCCPFCRESQASAVSAGGPGPSCSRPCSGSLWPAASETLSDLQCPSLVGITPDS